MVGKTTLQEDARSPIDGTEAVRLATAGANWRATTLGIRDAVDLKRGIVNVKAFGALGNNSNDDTAAIQAAIDFCYTNFTSGTRTIFMPGGLYKTTLPIFVDRPNNLRGNSANWVVGTTYAQNAVVTYAGIPWKSGFNDNVGNTPVLPKKGISSGAHLLGEVTEAHGLYWICILGYSGGGDPTTDVTHWAAYPRWWMPTTVAANNANWAATLLGEEGLGSAQDNFGTVLMPTFNNTVCLWSCHGNGNMIKNIAIRGPTTADGWGYRMGQPSDGVGIAIPGGGGGASRTLIENCEVTNFRYGIKTGVNSNALGDSNTFMKCNVTNTGYALNISETQNFINSVYDCNLQGTIGVYAPDGTCLTLVGGNLSVNSAQTAGFSISGTSAFTTTHIGNAYQNTFTTVISAPNSYLQAGVYNAFFIATTHFGIMRCDMTAFDPVTNIASMTVNQRWYDNMFDNNDAFTSITIIASEVQAATKIYAAEQVTTLYGGGINAQGFHIENPVAPTTMVNSAAGFGSQPVTSIKNVLYNFDPSNSGTPSTDGQWALKYACQLVGHIIVTTNELILEGVDFNQGRPVIFDSGGGTRVTLRNNVRTLGNFWWNIHADSKDQVGWVSDRPLYLPSAVLDAPSVSWRSTWGQSENWFLQPAFNSRPVITSSQLTALSGTLAPITNYGSGAGFGIRVPYPILYGRQPYTVCSFDVGHGGVVLPNYEIVSDHSWYSYGQDLTTTNVTNLSWSYQGQSVCVYANIELLLVIFPGLGIILNDGSTDVAYVVHNVYPELGYFTITVTGGVFLSGSKNSVITGTVVKQAPHSIRRLGFVKQINYQAPTTGTTITLNNNDTHVILNPIGTLATLTVKMCAAPFDGQEVDIKSSQTVTALTISPNTSQYAVGLPTTIGAGIVAKGIYRIADTTWYF